MISVRRLLIVLGALALLSAVMLGQAVLPMPRENLFWRSAFDAAHVPVFGVFALIVRLSLDWARERSSLVHDLVALVTAGLLGALVEVAQSFTGRDAALMDLVRDLLGAMAVLLAARAVMGRPWRQTIVRAAMAIVALGLLFFALRPPVEGILAYRQRDEAFPVLCSFETSWASRFWATRNTDVEVVAPPEEWNGVAAQRVARLTYRATEYPAFILREPHRDWSGYETLVIELFNPGDTVRIFAVRVDDRRHNGSVADRYNGRIEVPVGASTVEIPIEDIRRAPRDREMDMKQVRSLTLFASRPKEARTIYMAAIRLR